MPRTIPSPSISDRWIHSERSRRKDLHSIQALSPQNPPSQPLLEVATHTQVIKTEIQGNPIQPVKRKPDDSRKRLYPPPAQCVRKERRQREPGHLKGRRPHIPAPLLALIHHRLLIIIHLQLPRIISPDRLRATHQAREFGADSLGVGSTS